MEYRVEQNNGMADIAFSGAVTIEQMPEMKKVLADALHDAQQVRVDFSQADDVDLACLQTLCSAHRTAGGVDKELSINENRSAAFMKSVKAAGYVRHTGCKLGKTDTCLWVEKNRSVQ
ncbi:MAG: STAS domain-containing protein [Nitrospirae bacterium]|nr:STAS domain-containing protein [Nitrospirota bacterium]